MAIVLYSTGCPKCKVLKTKLDKKSIEYDIVSDLEIMKSKNFQSAPQLEVGSYTFDFSKAVKFVNMFDNSESFEEFVQHKISE